MILYFADRHLNILGQASTNLPEGVRVIDDVKTEDIETGVAIFECKIPFDRKTRSKVEEWAEVGNYVLRSSENENEFYNIIDAEIDTKKQTVYIYAEDDGLDLLNEVVGAYEADEYYPISDYIERFAAGSGWVIGVNEVEGLTRKLRWDSEQTASARLLSIAEAFNDCEISFSYKIDGLQIVKKYINIYEERGKDTGVQLRLNKEIDSIITTKSVANLATALKATGGTPDDSEEHITLLGYEYDDGNFYIDGYVLKSRKALEKWSRYLWNHDESQQSGGHIVKQFSYDTTSQAVLCEKAIEELKSICDMEVNYDIDISKFPENVKIGDRVNIIDDQGGLYLSSRVLILETSASDQTRRAVLGEHLIRKDGISSKVEKLAAQFAKSTVSVANAKAIATNAKALADQAKTQADAAKSEAEAAQSVADEAKTASDAATQSAANAQAKAQAAEAAVNKVEKSVSDIEQTVTDAKNAADNAYKAAETATEKAEEAKTAADNAVNDAAAAQTAAGNAQTASESAVSNAGAAVATANTAKSQAESAAYTAAAAKIDAEQAEKDLADFEGNLKTLTDTVEADYTRKTDLTETTEHLQSQISRNAGKITQNISATTMIDETANNALTKVQAAQQAATLAQEQADEASAAAVTAQTEANTAKAAAESAQSEADTAKAAAETAKAVADNAEAALKAAKLDLATVESRVDATEEEIAAAQQAVADAQSAADTAKADAQTAIAEAKTAQNVANAAVSTATAAQLNANKAKNEAEIAQQAADEASGNATEAQRKVDEAQAAATAAQTKASNAKAEADLAQDTADTAYLAAVEAQVTADNAAETAEKAEAKLLEAQQRLNEIQGQANATAEEVAAAQTAVDEAQAKATEARASADEAQAAADTAKTASDTAQASADTAKQAADNAQAEAKAAQDEVDKALGLVYSLEKRVTNAETGIEQTKSEIRLFAKKEDVIKSLGGYCTKEESEAAITVESDKITSSVRGAVSELQNADGEIIGRVSDSESQINQLRDSISMLVTDGNGSSLMTQTANGWTFSTSAIESAIKDTSESLGDLVEDLGSTEEAVDVLKKAVEDIGVKTDYVNISTYTYTNDEGTEVTEPCIELGESDSDYKVLITNTQILFKAGSNVPTRIDTDGIITENISVENELRQSNDDVDGYFVWAVRQNGNYGLQWKENDS